jgi:hypothetical protein
MKPFAFAGFSAYPLLLFAIAALAWLGPRLLWSQSWRANTQIAVASLPTCLAAQAAGLAWAAELRAGNIDTRAAFWRASARGERMWDFLPTVWATDAVKTYGSATANGWDGTKRLYDVSPLAAAAAAPVASAPAAAATAAARCVIYSFGSNLQTEFEESMLRATACDIFTFDCTVRADAMAAKIAAVTATLPSAALPGGGAPLSAAARFHFLPYCVGKEGHRVTMSGMNNGENSVESTLRSVPSIMAELGHARIDLLKMDTEGGEHIALPEVAKLVGPALPPQINFELHRMSAPGEGLLGQFVAVSSLIDAGYVLVSRDDNLVAAGCCSELTFVLGCSSEAK